MPRALRRRCRSLLIGLMLALPVISPSLASYRFVDLGVSDGLSQSRVLALAEDSRGFMWLGTEAGINLYDGYDISTLDHVVNQHPHLLSTNIFGLYGKRPGEMWVATARGVSRIDLASSQVTDVWHHTVHNDQSPGRYSQQAKFVEACDGSVIVARALDVFRLKPSHEGIAQTLWLTQGHSAQVSLFEKRFSMVTDADQTVWIADAYRLWRSSCDSPELALVHDRAKPEEISPRVSLAIDASGHLLWANDHLIDVIDAQSARPVATYPISQVTGEEVLWGLTVDEAGRIWSEGPEGIHQLTKIIDGSDSPRWESTRLWSSQQLNSRMSNIDAYIFPYKFEAGMSRDGLVWISSYYGLLVIDPQQGFVYRPSHDEPTSRVALQEINVLYVDRFGVLWFAGGLNGVSRYVPEAHRFGTLQHPNRTFRSARSLHAIEWQGKQYLVASWDGGELSIWHQNTAGDFEWLTSLPSQDQSDDLGQIGQIRAMARGDGPVVWLATSFSIWALDISNLSLRLVHRFADYENSLEARVYPNIGLVYDAQRSALLYMHSQNVWRVSGLEQSRDAEAVSLDWLELPQTIGAYISLIQLRDQRLVVGSTTGITVADLDQQTANSYPLGSSTGADPREVVVSLIEGAPGVLWIGTRRGLGRLALDSGPTGIEIRDWWLIDDGLADETIYSLAFDSMGDLWLSSNRGLSRIHLIDNDVEPARITQFGVGDGLPAYEFNSRAWTHDGAGRLYFGSVNGIAWFQPLQTQPHPIAPDVFLKTLTINDETIDLSVAEPKLVLSYQRNNLAVGYSGIHFSATGENRYSYWMEGHEANWVMAGEERMARYSRLPPGEYRFWVKAANLDGAWSAPRLLLTAQIKPPPWASPWAYVGYALLLIGMLAAISGSARRRHLKLEGLVAQRTLELEDKNQLIEAQAKQLEEALEARTLLFANISHEFRTPLTLIQTAIEQLDPKRQHTKASRLATQYLQRLTRLVDQLLDLSRLRLSGVQAAQRPWSVNQIVAITLDGFAYLATECGIELSSQITGKIETQVDQASVEKIILNLLTNALKYTPRGGQVLLKLEMQGDQVALSVSDTGPGIAKEQQEFIFERFQRIPSDETLMREGSGIGLALVKEAAAAIGGAIYIDSELGQGSRFTLLMPGWQVSELPNQIVGVGPSTQYLSNARLALDSALLSASAQGVDGGMSEVRTSSSEHPTVLVVEDNSDLRQYLTELLADQWRVIEAANGHKALEQLAKAEVDVVLADIMMPEMDGLALLAQVRDDFATSHIPFLLLSARHDTETRIRGLTLAADDFLTKPFQAEELKLKLRNIVLARELLRSSILRQLNVVIEPEAANDWPLAQQQLSPRDHKFLDRLNQWLVGHYANPDLTVVDMAEQLGVTERTLQRKIKALAGMSPMAFVTQYRLNQSIEALKNPSLTIQEIAFDLGFSSQQTFSRAFKQSFGIAPTQWREKNRPVI